MKFLELEIENFMALREANVKLSDRGLLLIQGVNSDDPSANSNGAGKSTIPDALAWCLFNVTGRGVSGDAVINNAIGKGTRVSLTIEDGDELYRVTRHRKHKAGKNSVVLERYASDLEEAIPAEEAWQDISKASDGETQKEINKIVGCSQEVFDAAVYSAQEKMPDLPGMTDKALKVLVEEASGVQVIERAYEIACKSRNTQKDLVSADRAAVESLHIKVKTLEEQYSELCTSRDGWAKTNAEKVEEKKREIKELGERLSELREKRSKTDAEKIASAIETLRKKVASVAEEKATLKRLSDASKKLFSEKVEAEANCKARSKRLLEAKKALDSIDSRVGTPCGECGKSYEEEDIELARSHALDAFVKLRDQESEAKTALALIVKRFEASEVEVSEFEAKMTDLSEVYRKIDRLSEMQSDVEELDREIERCIESAKSLAALAKNIKAEENPFDLTIHDNQRKVRAAQREMDDAKEKLEQKTRKLAQLEKAVSVFSPSGVRAQILDTVTPFLNDRTSTYLGALSDGRISATWQTLTKTAKGELREKFSIEVEKEGGAKAFAGLSGGEKRKVRLATGLALQDLVASRATKAIDLWVGDEIDDALDTSGLERLMGILDAKARERGTVLIISHNDLNDWIRDSITVVRKGAESRVEG